MHHDHERRMLMRTLWYVGLWLLVVLSTSVAAEAQSVQGAAGPSGAQGAASDLERCDKPMGAVTVVEPQDFVIRSLSQYQLGSPVGLIRLMIQQSNCFIVVERGVAMQNMMQERALGSSGQLRQGSNMGGGQMMTADFILTPAVVFAANDAGGLGGTVGAIAPLFGKGARWSGPSEAALPAASSSRKRRPACCSPIRAREF